MGDEKDRGCPCLYVKPCHMHCSCSEMFSSAGCYRCCRYGDFDQRKKAAQIIVYKAEREQALYEALISYGQHRSDCTSLYGCKCGLSEILMPED